MSDTWVSVGRGVCLQCKRRANLLAAGDSGGGPVRLCRECLRLEAAAEAKRRAQAGYRERNRECLRLKAARYRAAQEVERVVRELLG